MCTSLEASYNNLVRKWHEQLNNKLRQKPIIKEIRQLVVGI